MTRVSGKIHRMGVLPLLSTVLIAQVAAGGVAGQDVPPDMVPEVLQDLPQDVPPLQERPRWVIDGVPDTVWILVEETYAVEDRTLALEMLDDAETHARAAIAMEGHGDDIGRRFALAVVLGRQADIHGGRAKVGAASDFHKELEAVLALEPEHPQARHLMGRLYAGIRRMGRVTRWVATNLLGGNELKKATWEAAEEHLLFAEQMQPDISDHHLQLANLYRDTNRPELALQEARHVLELPASAPLEIVVRNEATKLEARLVEKGVRP